MLLQSGAGEILDSIVCSVSSILNGMRDILNVVFDLLVVGGIGHGIGADEIDQGLDALDKESGLIFEVILQPVRVPP